MYMYLYLHACALIYICDPIWEKVHFRAKIENGVTGTVRKRVTCTIRQRKPHLYSVFLSRVMRVSVIALGYASFGEIMH